MKTLQEQLNEWKARRAEAADEMAKGIEENNRLMYKFAFSDWNYANDRINGILEAMTK